MRLNQINNRLGDLHVDIENFLDHFLGGDVKREVCGALTAPRTDISESDSEYRLVMELPGVEADDVTIEMVDGKLKVFGQRDIAPAVEGVQLLKSERVGGEFERSFDFKSKVDSEKIDAEFKNGLLTIVLPKPEKVLPRKIEIKKAD